MNRVDTTPMFPKELMPRFRVCLQEWPQNRFVLSPKQYIQALRQKTSLLMFALFVAAAPAKAQVNTSVPDLFERLNGEIERAADEQLAKTHPISLHAPAWFLIPASIPVGTPLPASGSLNANTSPIRVNAAALHLEELGVNARKIFEEAGVPVELLAVAGVESGFNPHARSPKGALGVWQFMPATARRYGLRVNETIDDRLNPELETHAAVRYLRDLHLKFGDWILALAAYDAGEDRVQTAIERSGITDFWILKQQHLLSKETRNYVPAVLGPPYGGDRRTMRTPWAHLSALGVKGIERFAQSDSKE